MLLFKYFAGNIKSKRCFLCRVAELYRVQRSRQFPFSHVGSVSEVFMFLFEEFLVAAIIVQEEEGDVVEKRGENEDGSDEETLLMRNDAKTAYLFLFEFLSP